MNDMDPIFKALADPHRRLLLDRLHARDGQALSELQTDLPMSRFGVMKHLRLLEEAGLVASRKVGRERLHYLNPVPIQRLYERWVGKFARPWVRALSGLKDALEEEQMGIADQPNGKPAHVHQVFIRTTPERLWQALTDGTLTRRYYFGTAVESTWAPGAPYRYRRDDGAPMIEGEVLAADPPRRLVTTFRPMWDADGVAPATSRVTFEIEPLGDACKLTLTHEGLTDAAAVGLNDGWSRILSGLKTLLETGEPLTIGG